MINLKNFRAAFGFVFIRVLMQNFGLVRWRPELLLSIWCWNSSLCNLVVLRNDIFMC